MFPILLVLALIGVTPAAPQQSIAEIGRVFRNDDAEHAELAAALATLESLDSVAAARCIVEAHARVQERVDDAEQGVRDARSKADFDRLKAERDALVGIRDGLLTRLENFRDPATVDWLFGVVRKRTESLAVRAAALGSVAKHGIDSPKDAEILLDLYAALESTAVDVEERRDEAIRARSARSVSPLRSELDPLRYFQDAITLALLAIDDPATLERLFEIVVGRARVPLSVRVALARHAAATGALGHESFQAALKKTRRAEEYAVVLAAIGRSGKTAERSADRVVDLLGHDDATVRESAADALATLAVPQSIAPLIDRLAVDEGRTRRRMIAALESITRQKLGTSTNVWRSWFRDHGDSFTSGSVPLGGGTTSFEPDDKRGYYYGIPQVGKAIVYVIDVSGSMAESVDSDSRYKPTESARPGQTSRLQACQTELKRALAALPPGTRFNIVAYSHVTRLYAEGLIEASPESVKAAQEWTDRLRAEGATNIYDALQVAFRLGGSTVADSYHDSTLETIFLLTDGKPLLPDRTSDSTERIRGAVRRWNPFRKVVIHAIGIGKGVNAGFLEALAQENGGRYVKK